MISADVKADVKQQEENWWTSCIFYYFMRSTFNLKYNVPSGMYFSLNFTWDFIQPGLVR